MIKTFSPKTCAFDCEWVPCPVTARRLLGLPTDTSDAHAMHAAWRRYAKEGEERPFLKLVLSQVVSIAAVIRQRDDNGHIKLGMYARGVDEYAEGELIGNFLEGVAKRQWQLWGFNSAGSDT